MSKRRLLVVDDEPGLLRVLTRYLTKLNYDVAAASSAAEAETAFRADPRSFAAVVTDMALPDMRGDDLVRRLIGLNPDVAVLFLSGTALDSAGLPLVRAGARFLQKPFTPQMLAESLAALTGA